MDDYESDLSDSFVEVELSLPCESLLTQAEKGWATVRFETEEAAQAAIDNSTVLTLVAEVDTNRSLRMKHLTCYFLVRAVLCVCVCV